MERSVLARRLGIGIGAIATVAMAVIAAAPWPRPGSSASTQAEILLLYVGADDCAPCRVWQNGEGAAFRASAQIARLSYREVKSATLLDVLKDEHWPDDLRGYRDRLGAGAGVPLWLVIADGEIVGRAFGASQWRSAVLPKLESLLP